MFTHLGRFTHRRRWWVIAGSAVFAVLAAVWGTGLFTQVSDGGFVDPDAESTRADELITDELDTATPDVVVIYRDAGGTPRDGDVIAEDGAFAEAVTDQLDALPSAPVEDVTHFWDMDPEDLTRYALISDDGRATYAAITLRGSGEEERTESYAELVGHLEDQRDALADADVTVRIGGAAAMMSEMSEQAERDVIVAELVSLPLLLLFLVIIFGGLVAASMPLLLAVLAILGSLTALHALALVTDISVFAVNVATILGLGLAIDYGLFIVSRFREELARRGSVEEALPVTVATAGRTVAFSGVAVLIAFCGLLFFPQAIMRSIGLGGIAVVLFDMVAALVVLPAILAVVGHRVNALRIPGLRRRRARESETGGWHRLARTVMRRPFVSLILVAVVLATFGAPLLGLKPGITDQRYLPPDDDTRVVAEMMDEDFPGGTGTIDVVVTGDVSDDALEDYAERLDSLEAAAQVDLRSPANGDVAHLVVSFTGEIDDDETTALVTEVRETTPPEGADEVLAGGMAAASVDNLDAILEALPWTILVVVSATLVFLFMAFGSVILPVKAVLMGVLSLAASLGVVVWGFQEGALATLLGFDAVGTTDPTYLVIIVVAAFGLAMDYELFLLSRVREEYLATGDNTQSVAVGLQRTGHIITSAALLLVIVLVSMGTSAIVFLKIMGIGLAAAIVIDATLVRAILVPAAMRLMGRANWWLPGWLRWLHDRIGVTETEEATPAGPNSRATGEDARSRTTELVGGPPGDA
ncbi:MMPL family transporter [Spiractinospora alimapuensis]|uniref:MMPL family transporter n=1 Tax=Spiractinospora alimapuensis TaxID=2820884 RepID=UPI001F36F988|nr:MMPL family transporter [Spiractinospora alimapuensis]QVQ52418.1 MMPL family transporter [Spiractinospora alimapuensis]